MINESLAETAAFLSQEWPVFPCSPDKRPCTMHGFKDATRDPEEARNLFRSPGAALIGVPTGPDSNLFVIDIDTRDDGAGLQWLAENESRLPKTRRHRTRSGGVHLLFQYPEGIDARNTVNRIAPGIDTRGRGGYIISAPSNGYTILDDAMPAEMPAWLVLACAKPEAPKPAPAPTERLERYTQAAIDGEVLSVMRAGEGTRNDQLNTSAVKLGSLVAAGQVSRSTVEMELTSAALAAGLDRREVAATVKSGLDFGMSRPREMPEPKAKSDNRTSTGQPDMSADAPVSGLPLLWFDDIKPVLDTHDFVQGVLVEGSAAVVYGESNAGKTFWTTDLALSVASGRPWNGRRIEAGGVVYCALEGGTGFRNRVSAWRKAQGLDGCDVPFAAIPASINLLDPKADTPRLIEAVAAAVEHMGCPVKLIVIDTLARAFAGGNENSSEDMGALVANMDLIRAETGACVLFVHHSGKDQARGARGHSSLRAAIDTEIEVVAGEGDAKTATVVKQREMSKGDVFNFTLEVVELGKNRHDEAVTTCLVTHGDTGKAGAPKKDNSSQQRKMAYDTLVELFGHTGRPVSTAVWREAFKEACGEEMSAGAKQKAFNRHSDELVEKYMLVERDMDKKRAWIRPRNNANTEIRT